MSQPAIRILIVDDEPAIRRALRPPLAELGFQVAEASRGEEALQLLRARNLRCGAARHQHARHRRHRDAAPHPRLRAPAARPHAHRPRPGRRQSRGARIGRRRLRHQALQHSRTASRASAPPFAACTPRPALKTRPSKSAKSASTRVKRSVTKRGQPVHLTRKEFDILHCLMSRAGRVVTYAKLLTAVWGADCREEVEYLRTFVRQLRKKIEDDPSNPALPAHRCLCRLPLCRRADAPRQQQRW